jgi:hypothetical protein
MSELGVGCVEAGEYFSEASYGSWLRSIIDIDDIDLEIDINLENGNPLTRCWMA